ncbi:hypothetical protein LCGC14_1390290 [marine sediment metagenome]|uniref:Uncharacterized protein n=1 Tax=marine sediment metagenome TaxID=412755 RepID=A0A0F9KKZ6_9ZZZZ
MWGKKKRMPTNDPEYQKKYMKEYRKSHPQGKSTSKKSSKGSKEVKSKVVKKKDSFVPKDSIEYLVNLMWRQYKNKSLNFAHLKHINAVQNFLNNL